MLCVELRETKIVYRSELFTVARLYIVVFWVMTPYSWWMVNNVSPNW